MSPNPYEFIGFGATDVTKLCELIGFGALGVTKPYEFIWFVFCGGGLFTRGGVCLGGLIKRTPLKGIRRGRQEEPSRWDRTCGRNVNLRGLSRGLVKRVRQAKGLWARSAQTLVLTVPLDVPP